MVVGLFGPFDVLDGCLITGIAQVYNYGVYKTSNTNFGDAVGPISAVSSLLVR